MTSQLVAEKIEKITPALARKAQYLANASPEHDANDLYQEGVLRVLERGESDPTFCEQKDQYVIWDAVHSGCKRAARKSRTYGKYVEPEPKAYSDEDEDIDWIETLADTSSNPEDQFIQSEELTRLSGAISTLSPENQKIIGMLYQGYSQNEIAATLGIGKSAVSQRKATIEKQIGQWLAWSA
jgi:RNA polymerase sigma factor (sigma-70 family)